MVKRSRNIRISVRLNQKEHEELKEKCKITDFSIEGMVRSLITGCNIKPRPPDSYKDLAREISAVGNNINQIAHVANSTGRISEAQVREATELLRQIWRLVQERV